MNNGIPLLNVEGFQPTEAQLAYEKPARLLCKKRGHNPDELLTVPVDTVLGRREMKVAQWVFGADELISFSECLTSLKEAATSRDN